MYVTFMGTNNGPCRGFYRKQALADAAATDNADVTAHTGALEVGDFIPSNAYFDGTSIVGEDAYETAQYLALPEVDKLKAGFRAFHDALIRGSEFLETPSIRRYYPEEDHRIAHTMLALTHRACRGVGLSMEWNAIQKFAWLQAMGQGPTDVGFESGPEVAAERFFAVLETARMTDSPITSPDEYFMWAAPDTATRWALAASDGETGSVVDQFAAAATDFSVFHAGGWINDITV